MSPAEILDQVISVGVVLCAAFALALVGAVVLYAIKGDQ